MFVPGTTSRPPTDMVMPYETQLIFTFLADLPAIPYLIFAFRRFLKDEDPAALLMFIGGFFASSFEAIVDVMGGCFFPREGQITGYEWFGRPVPAFVPLNYGWFVGGMGYWSLTVLRNPTTTRRDLWSLWAKFIVINLILEYPPLYFGIYTYYGHQPFQVFGFPLWFPCINAISPIVAATITHLISPYLTGWRRYVMVTTTASSYGLSHAAFAFPLWIALSTDKGLGVTYPAAVITFVLLATGVWIMSLSLPEQSSIRLKSNVRVSTTKE
ncbi:hypothetical protein F5883DRAFT_514691 [Diaporthe sp. PMI_573]|nr:hypothetical protein F5883DRAFT_514691 [Diaporthaceae sp. PMI_573]